VVTLEPPGVLALVRAMHNGGGLAGITSLEFSDNPPFLFQGSWEAVFESLGQLPLTTLVINREYIKPARMTELAEAIKKGGFRALQVLEMPDNQSMKDEGRAALFSALAQPGTCPTLETLDLSDNGEAPAAGRALAQALATPGALPSLQALNLKRNRLGAEAYAAIAEALRDPTAAPSLTLLELSSEAQREVFAGIVGEAAQVVPLNPTATTTVTEVTIARPGLASRSVQFQKY
jgi:hypothetical protein